MTSVQTCSICKGSETLVCFRSCGHIFCAPCANRHFAHRDFFRCIKKGNIPREFSFELDRWRRCPVCQDEKSQTDFWDSYDQLRDVNPAKTFDCPNIKCNAQHVTAQHAVRCGYRLVRCPLDSNCAGFLCANNVIQFRTELDYHLRHGCTHHVSCKEPECFAKNVPRFISSMISHQQYHAFKDDVDVVSKNVGMLLFHEWGSLHGEQDLVCLLRNLVNRPTPEKWQQPSEGMPSIKCESPHRPGSSVFVPPSQSQECKSSIHV
jgi:hypothetical protein